MPRLVRLGDMLTQEDRAAHRRDLPGVPLDEDRLVEVVDEDEYLSADEARAAYGPPPTPADASPGKACPAHPGAPARPGPSRPASASLAPMPLDACGEEDEAVGGAFPLPAPHAPGSGAALPETTLPETTPPEANPPGPAPDAPQAGAAAAGPSPAAGPPPSDPSPPDPPSSAPRHDGWTPDRQRRFLEALAEGHGVEAACRIVGMTHQSAYALRRRAAGAAFALGWQAAQLLARQKLADALLVRAIHGQRETLTRANGDVIVRHRFDNRLATAMLTRLDRLAEAGAQPGVDQGAAIVAQEFEAYLDAVADERGEERDDRGGEPADTTDSAARFLADRCPPEPLPDPDPTPAPNPIPAPLTPSPPAQDVPAAPAASTQPETSAEPAPQAAPDAHDDNPQLPQLRARPDGARPRRRRPAASRSRPPETGNGDDNADDSADDNGGDGNGSTGNGGKAPSGP